MVKAIINANFIAEAQKLAQQGLMVKDIYYTLGVSANTWYRYWSVGRDMSEKGESDTDHPEDYKLLCQALYEAVQQGRTGVRQEAVGIIREKMLKGDLKAAIYLLEHLDPEWKKTQRSEHSGEVRIVVSRGKDDE